MKIALYGGAFDPPHSGHALVVAAILNSHLVEEVWVVPMGDRYDKKQVQPANIRLEMLNLFKEEEFQGSNRIQIRDDETRSEGANSGGSTVSLVRYYRRLYPHNQFLFVIGSDLLRDLPVWRNVEELKREVLFLVVEREGAPLSLPDGFNITIVASAFVTSLASSAVRGVCGRGELTAGMLCPSVRRYIQDHGLYRV